MPMKNPAHPGRIIRSNLQALWVSVEETAPKLGLTPEQLSQVIDGEASVTDAMAAGLGELFGCGADIWRRMQASYDEAQERNKYDVSEEPALWISCPERASVPIKNGRAVYTTYDDTVLRFRYLESGNTDLSLVGEGYIRPGGNPVRRRRAGSLADTAGPPTRADRHPPLGGRRPLQGVPGLGCRPRWPPLGPHKR